MRKAEIDQAFRDAEEANRKIAGLVYHESLSGGGFIEVDVSRLPHACPRVQIVDARHHPVTVGDLPAAHAARVAEVKCAIEKWWNDGGEWPTSPPPDRRFA